MHATLSRSDVWLAGASSVVAAVTLSLALAPSRRSLELPTTPVVALIAESSGDVKLRLSSALGWGGASRGEDVHDGDSVFVPPGGTAMLRFTDGTELALDERTLVVVEMPHAGERAVTLRQGSASSRTGTEGLTLQTPAGEAKLGAQAEASVELSGEKLEVLVKKGVAEVKGGGQSATVRGGERVAAAKSGTVQLVAWPVTLLTPEPQARMAFRSTPPALTLTWKGATENARVQIARDRLFAFTDVELPAEGGTVELLEPARGVSWWRLVNAQGRAISEARRFSFVEDRAPVAMFPRMGEVVLAPPGTSVSFAWTPLPGVTRYLVEISPSRGFEPVVATHAVTGTSAPLPLSLNEAEYFWRVRADDDGGGVPSAPLKFRVIHKGIPEAPELLNPEIEVTP